MTGGTDNNQLKLAAKTWWQWRQQWKQKLRAQQRLPRARQQLPPWPWRRWNRLRHPLGGLWVLVVMVVCGVVRAGCVCAARPYCFVRGSHAKVHQKFGKPRHIRDRRKALDKTSQTITFYQGKSVGFKKLWTNLAYL